MEQGLSRVANRFSASQEIPRILWKPKAHYRPGHRPYPKPDQSSPCLPSRFLKIHFNIILPSTPRISRWSLSLRFPHQNPVYASPLPHTCYMPRLYRSSRFDHPNNIWWAVHIIKLLIVQFSPLPCYLVPLRPKYSPQHHILKHPKPSSLPHFERPSFTPIQNRQYYSSVYLNLQIFG